MTFFITGAGRGIGLEFVRQLLAAQHTVIATVRDPYKSTALQDLKARYSKTLSILVADVTDKAQIEAAAAQVSAPAIDVLINNAGVLLDQGMSLEKINKDVLMKSFEVNTLAPMFVTRALLPKLRAAPKPVVANVTSLMGSITDNESGGYYAYRMSKTALNMFAKSFSKDFPKIKIISLHPGWVKTDMGGSQATTTPEESVRGLLRVILGTKHPTGSFVDFTGKQLEW